MSTTTLSGASLPEEWSDIFQRKSYVFSSDHVASLIPKLTSTAHKGSYGRIAIFGGSEKYTGAPYYAATAALTCGVDLVTVFCAKEACIPIKCYSPELMVQSVYSVDELDDFRREDVALKTILQKSECKEVEYKSLTAQQRTLRDKQQLSLHNTISAVTSTFPSLHALCIGPGLGRHELLFPAVSSIIEKAIECNLSLILDADALFMLGLDEYRDLLLRLMRYEHVVMTPNLMEFRRLKSALQNGTSEDCVDDCLDNTGIIVQKGSSDILTQQSVMLECKEKGGLKRSGGIGDVLAGTISAFMAWNRLQNSLKDKKHATRQEDQIMATWAACCAVKKATSRAFDRKRRSMSAQNVLEEISEVIRDMEQDLELHKG
jgi:ATP-dependent NAD(P)H-hydrate dehydratase